MTHPSLNAELTRANSIVSPVELAFDAAEYDRRLGVLREAMRAAGVDVAVITAPDTMAWLHGYRTRWYRQHTSTSLPPAQCTVVHANDDVYFMIEAGYHLDVVAANSVVPEIRPLPSSFEEEVTLAEYVAFLEHEFRREGWEGATVGIERWSCIPSPAVANVVEGMLESIGCKIVDTTIPFRSARSKKSAAEVEKIELAQRACDAGILALQAGATREMTELEGWALYTSGMVAAGGEPAALHETVATGTSLSGLHRLSGRTPLGASYLFHPDAAAAYDGYHARATRPLVFGTAPAEDVSNAAVQAESFEVFAEHAVPGTPWRHVQEKLREHYRSAGLEPAGAGYELGVTVAPADWVGEFSWSIDTKTDAVIEAGMVMNYETWSTVVIVDTFVFEETGPRFLSSLPRTVLEVA
ncbi:M24 family metallopeptidase [Agromyces humatus]|uniref:Aminopeptidase P family protein n=1 Tax=Agromyces humatus TaxID=279573 RepID=A0ABP4WPS6_9MICO|nr:M24 family metallopeptidase [Agromyces humatus]